jgi:hypothetical protein
LFASAPAPLEKEIAEGKTEQSPEKQPELSDDSSDKE